MKPIKSDHKTQKWNTSNGVLCCCSACPNLVSLKTKHGNIETLVSKGVVSSPWNPSLITKHDNESQANELLATWIYLI
jgi:hypothetical protein